jgi:hypothetical protein
MKKIFFHAIFVIAISVLAFSSCEHIFPYLNDGENYTVYDEHGTPYAGIVSRIIAHPLPPELSGDSIPGNSGFNTDIDIYRVDVAKIEVKKLSIKLPLEVPIISIYKDGGAETGISLVTFKNYVVPCEELELWYTQDGITTKALFYYCENEIEITMHSNRNDRDFHVYFERGWNLVDSENEKHSTQISGFVNAGYRWVFTTKQ